MHVKKEEMVPSNQIQANTSSQERDKHDLQQANKRKQCIISQHVDTPFLPSLF